MHESAQVRVVRATSLTFPYSRTHDLYQEYYRNAIRSFSEANHIVYTDKSEAYSPPALHKLRSLRHSYKLSKIIQKRPIASFIDGIARMLSRGPLHPAFPVGCYHFTMSTGDSLAVAIDSMDSGDIFDEVAARSDVYFKSNFWPARRYPDNVLPLPNMNPIVGQDIPFFTGLRNTPKDIDLFAFFRLWGGGNETDGIEHNISLIESLAQVPCEKYLCAYLVAGDIPSLAKRLNSQGVHWTTDPMPKHELCGRAASARLNIVRLGMHECSPWRMIDILAMGGCPVIDYGPQTRWPIPLQENQHYLNLRVAPHSKSKETVSENVMQWLGTLGLTEEIGRNAAEYFDQHLAHLPLGEHIVSQCEAAAMVRSTRIS